MHEQYQSEEVRDQIDFMLQVYRSIVLLYWTLTELQTLRRQQNVLDKITAMSKALSDTTTIINLVSEFGSLAFSKGLLFGPVSSLFLGLSKQRSLSQKDKFSWRLRMVLMINFLKRFASKYN